MDFNVFSEIASTNFSRHFAWSSVLKYFSVHEAKSILDCYSIKAQGNRRLFLGAFQLEVRYDLFKDKTPPLVSVHRCWGGGGLNKQ